jgi:hypothetical protein
MTPMRNKQWQEQKQMPPLCHGMANKRIDKDKATADSSAAVGLPFKVKSHFAVFDNLDVPVVVILKVKISLNESSHVN